MEKTWNNLSKCLTWTYKRNKTYHLNFKLIYELKRHISLIFIFNVHEVCFFFVFFYKFVLIIFIWAISPHLLEKTFPKLVLFICLGVETKRNTLHNESAQQQPQQVTYTFIQCFGSVSFWCGSGSADPLLG